MGVISILIIIVAALLVIVVLIQNSKGGGIASNFASSTQVVGVKRQAEIIEKITWGLAAALIILSLSSSALVGQGPQVVEPTNSVVKDAPGIKNNTGTGGTNQIQNQQGGGTGSTGGTGGTATKPK